jgi:hypothetical protein
LARDIYGLGGRPALRDPYGASAAGRPLEPACRDQGKVIFAGSTFRREKMRCLVWRGTSITAQSRCSSTSLPPLIAHPRSLGTMVDPIQKLAMVPRLWSGRNDGRRRELRSPNLRRAMTANSGHGRRSGQGAPSVRSTSSTGNILSPPALTLRAKSGQWAGLLDHLDPTRFAETLILGGAE